VTVLAIDPGYEQSAVVLYDGSRVETHRILPNDELLSHLCHDDDLPETCVIEQIASYGMPVGAEVFGTVRWSGRFEQAFLMRNRLRNSVALMPRRDVKLHLCNSARAKDANVRQALLDRFGGEKVAKGTKAAPGPLYGLKKDEWAALAIAVTWMDTKCPAAP
jgi:hypothetical protein